MKTSDKAGDLMKALAKAQASFKPVPKNKTANVRLRDGGKYEFKYASLPDVLQAVLPALNENGIVLSQGTVLQGDDVLVRTRLQWGDQWVEADYYVSPIMPDHQKMGAAMTYARRYALTALLGVAADEDADGFIPDDAVRKTVRDNRPPPEVKPVEYVQKLDPDLSADLRDALLDELGALRNENAPRARLQAWVTDSQKSRAKLTADDAAQVKDTYRALEKLASNGYRQAAE